jgi:DNA-binding Lrp family transcriptional regulator
MDELDRRLLRELELDARAHVTTLAHRLGVPRSTVQERIRRLVVDRVLRGFRPIVDHAQLGNPTLAYILASFIAGSGAHHRQTAKDLLRIPGVESVDFVSGEWDLLVRVRGESFEAIGNMLVDRIRTMPTIARTVTMPSFHTEEAEPSAHRGR